MLSLERARATSVVVRMVRAFGPSVRGVSGSPHIFLDT